MSHQNASRKQNLLLMQKILAFRPETSPFTLVLDSVDQGAGGLVREVVRSLKGGKGGKVSAFDGVFCNLNFEWSILGCFGTFGRFGDFVILIYFFHF